MFFVGLFLNHMTHNAFVKSLTVKVWVVLVVSVRKNLFAAGPYSTPHKPTAGGPTSVEWGVLGAVGHCHGSFTTHHSAIVAQSHVKKQVSFYSLIPLAYDMDRSDSTGSQSSVASDVPEEPYPSLHQFIELFILTLLTLHQKRQSK